MLKAKSCPVERIASLRCACALRFLHRGYRLSDSGLDGVCMREPTHCGGRPAIAERGCGRRSANASRAFADGNLPEGADPEALARYLVTVMRGWPSRLRAAREEESFIRLWTWPCASAPNRTGERVVDEPGDCCSGVKRA
jgi:hypothetical protein